MTSKSASGRELVREALRVANLKTNLASMARELGVTAEQIQGFAENRIATLPPDLMAKVVAWRWPNNNVRYDAERDLLVAIEREATAPGAHMSREPCPVGPKWTKVDRLAKPLAPLREEPKREGWLR
jgi:hypothetical protein